MNPILFTIGRVPTSDDKVTMGVQNLYTEVIDRNKYDLVDGRCVHHLEDIPEQSRRFGVDLSVQLHRCLRGVDAAAQFHQHPRVPLTFALAELKKFHAGVVKQGGHPLYVIDGSFHPMKARTDKKRDAKRSSFLKKMYEEY